MSQTTLNAQGKSGTVLNQFTITNLLTLMTICRKLLTGSFLDIKKKQLPKRVSFLLQVTITNGQTEKGIEPI